MKMTMKTFSAFIKPYKKQMKILLRLLTFLTLVMVVINYIIMMSVIVVIC